MRLTAVSLLSALVGFAFAKFTFLFYGSTARELLWEYKLLDVLLFSFLFYIPLWFVLYRYYTWLVGLQLAENQKNHSEKKDEN